MDVPTCCVQGFETSLGQILGVIESQVWYAGGKQNIAGIGIGAPGPLNPKNGVVINPPQSARLARNIPLARQVAKQFGITTRLENDCQRRRGWPKSCSARR